MSYDDPNFEFVQELWKQSPTALAPTTVSKAISKEVKFNGNFEKGEQLFDILVQILKRKESSKPDYYFSDLDIKAVQIGLSALVRYAPSPAQARYYFCLALRDLEEPLRTAPFELTLLNNLLYVCSVNVNDEENMKNSLALIETALEIGVFHVDIPRSYAIQNVHFKDPRDVFETLTKKVLRHYRLELNQDKTGLQPSNKFSR